MKKIILKILIALGILVGLVLFFMGAYWAIITTIKGIPVAFFAVTVIALIGLIALIWATACEIVNEKSNL
jgi:hypothetical protein